MRYKSVYPIRRISLFQCRINMDNLQMVALGLVLMASCVLAEFSFSDEQDDHDHGYNHDVDHEHDVDYHAEPSYKFDYAVRDGHSGDEKSQWEERDGDSVRGGYSLTEPDGRVRHVEYTADKDKGFSAVVRTSGQARHPDVYGDTNPHGYHNH